METSMNTNTKTTSTTPTLALSSKTIRNCAASVHEGVPVIDLAPLFEQEDSSSSSTTTTCISTVVAAIAQACAEPGFFQVVNHGIPLTLIQDFRTQCQLYFQLDHDVKQSFKRHAGNSRGYFDDELTKQRRDWKECLDMGVPGSRQWDNNILPDNAPENECLDGFNQLPSTSILPDYRRVAVEYFDACAQLSQRLAVLMAQGLGKNQNDPFIVDLETTHTSYLRSNYYPPCPDMSSSANDETEDPSPLGISPHKDAGFLTVLLQDDDCHSLQVLRKNDCNSKKTNNNSKNDDECWMTVHPLPGALTINTGDMAQIWSNNKYKAPLHRVLAHRDKPRYSAPFFFNPGYQTMVKPATVVMNNHDDDGDDNKKSSISSTMMMIPKYHGVLWGYFRAIRFAGDLTDLGVEIQISDFCKNHGGDDNDDNTEDEDGANHKSSSHLVYQKVFQDRGLTDRAFNVDEYREILKEIDGEK